ncbi:uncharacterized protein LOC108472924 [Gossypium arboreum]|uniref:Uncharacterized protein n=1 Tax=Gossypium arboreum TaxID=29729 RepID=A0ABR0N609_GOSAR|nr:uncharacterized protein LOC108472924 [Gossypium arboreum]KAK5786009.1 hypothetical protein PVK06_040633 [Gossypium arboreum]
MDPEKQDVIKFILYLMLLEVEMRKKREKTEEMEKQLRADQAALEAMENKRLMLMSERDDKIAEKKTVDKLVADFLRADANGDFEAQKAMENQIVALISRDAGDTGPSGGGG